jgi:O-acetyl-ADP-ribose deacetylase (regulator of RNase III)
MESYINENQIISHILPNIFIGNYLAVDNEIIDMYDISGIIIAASGIKSNSIKPKINIINLDWMEKEDEDLYPGIIKSFGFIEEHLNQNKNILVVCKFGMNRSVTVVLAWLMMYKNLDFNVAYNLVKLARPIIDPIPIYISKLIHAHNSLKNEFQDWISVKCINSQELAKLFNYDIGTFNKYTGYYPQKFDQISELSDDVISMKNNKSIVDNAKNVNNRLRKDQPIELIEENEKECKLLLNGFYKIPKLKRVDILNKVKLTNKFILDLEADAIVNTANEALMGGGGMDLLIHTYAGPSLKLETSQLPNVIEGNYYYGVKCLTADAKITSGHNLNSKYIIHVVTPYLDLDGKTDKKAHVNSYKSILKYIDGINIRKITIGPISTGYYGYPMLEATILGLLTIRKYLEENYNLVDTINLWIYNQTQYKIYEYLISQIL